MDLRTGWDLNDPAQGAQQERPILIVGSWSGHSAGTSHMRWKIDIYRWQVSQGRFFVHQHSGNLLLTADLCAMKSVVVSRIDWWWTFLSNCEEIHSKISKLHCWSHVAENCIVAVIRGLRQALTRLGCLQALESGLTVKEPCPAEMADYDHVYYDNVTGASLPSKMSEEAMQLEIKYMKEMNVYTPLRARSRESLDSTPVNTAHTAQCSLFTSAERIACAWLKNCITSLCA